VRLSHNLYGATAPKLVDHVMVGLHELRPHPNDADANTAFYLTVAQGLSRLTRDDPTHMKHRAQPAMFFAMCCEGMESPSGVVVSKARDCLLHILRHCVTPAMVAEARAAAGAADADSDSHSAGPSSSSAAAAAGKKGKKNKTKKGRSAGAAAAAAGGAEDMDMADADTKSGGAADGDDDADSAASAASAGGAGGGARPASQLQSIIASLQSLLGLRYKAVWHMCFGIIGTAFEVLPTGTERSGAAPQWLNSHCNRLTVLCLCR
jgi:hypothetical protein